MRFLALLLALAAPARAQLVGDTVRGHVGDTVTVRYIIQPTAAWARVVSKSGLSLSRLPVTVLAAPTSPPPVVQPPAPPPPAPVAGAPWLLEDFTEYGGSTATYKTDPRHIWSVGEDGDFGGGIGSIDTVGGASLRLDFPASNGLCTDFSTGRNLNLPGDATEAWIEVDVRFSPGFATKSPWTCSSNADYKLLLGRIRAPSGRYNLAIVGTYCCEFTVGYPGNEDGWEGGDATKLFDGQWHVLHIHVKAGTAGLQTFAVDGVLVKDYGTVNTTTAALWGLAIGRNMNQGQPVPESVWWKRIAVWQTNPGW